MDGALAALFQSSQASSKTPAKRVKLAVREASRGQEVNHDPDESGDEYGSSVEGDPNELSQPQKGSKASRKRKRGAIEDDIEGKYMQRVAREQEREEAIADANRALDKSSRQSPSAEGTSSEGDENSDSYEIPAHETVAASRTDTEVEKASRTVFLGNVSTAAIKSKASHRELVEHMSSFFSDLPDHQPPHAVESLRFRSTAYATASVPKKAAFVKKELMDATTKSTNAYVVYNTAHAAREAVKRLNGSVVLERHLRVDGVAHPSQTDHRRCVFVGNLGFVDDESMIRAAEEREGVTTTRKAKPSADVEEGLWREFAKAGAVESVRVVRDKTTRVGKGFAYVQFKDQNAVEKALLFHDQKFPPLLPRKLRVTRAKNIAKTSSHLAKDRPTRGPSRQEKYSQKPSSQSQSLAGRAKKLLGRAGAAKAGGRPLRESIGVGKTPEQVVFEGNRARVTQGKKGMFKAGKAKAKKQGKPTTRSSKRGASFKAAGGQKKKQQQRV